MSDFLNILAARSLSETPQVTPRLLTRFEAEAGAPVGLEELAFEREAPRVPPPAPVVAAPPPLPAMVAQLESPRALPRLAATVPDAPAQPAPGRQEQRAALLPTPATPQPLVVSADPLPRTPIRGQPSEPIVPHDRARHALSEPVVLHDRARHVPGEPAPAQPRPVAAALAALLPRTIQPPQPVALTQAQPPDATTRLVPALPLPLHDLPVRPHPRHAGTDVTNAAPPMPTIQVTIGRIEVRATAPARPTRTERAMPSVMSLDEYLRQRDGGRR
ncbi:hypothetical protein EYB53_021750 [Candidatus Chloroploca sp. M-50]|uniref:Uncharacterized protein n=1 Tax=Candidatus Chloroploca mongolica TaxID=2528176 RepID=A0ABS4DFX9_9CHLR|nr:hypothetical protein [Candidatus Chloroploca mongolica]MBP1468351.1 hypothetical protein [Candidatus Chloroploca mongolica]